MAGRTTPPLSRNGTPPLPNNDGAEPEDGPRAGSVWRKPSGELCNEEIGEYNEDESATSQTGSDAHHGHVASGDNSSTASTEPFGGARRAEVDPNKLAPRFSAPSGRAPFAQAGTVRAAGADSESAGLIAKKRSRSLGDSGPVSGRVGAADLTCGKCGREFKYPKRLETHIKMCGEFLR